MAEHDGPAESQGTTEVDGASGEADERIHPLVTRRDFLIGAGTGAVAVGVVAGAGFAASQARRQVTAPQPVVQTGPGGPAVAPPVAPGLAPQPAQAPAQQTLPLTMRKVTLDIDNGMHEVVVDVRESLWETMTNKLGMVAANLGCDRAQCGACTVVVDGRAVNGCTVLSARLGRGQKILTAAGLARGPGVEGLHPVQKAFWQEGGYQCGICTRGFIMSSYALLEKNKNPGDDEIAEALAGNICRCGEYVKIFTAVKTAAAELRGEKVTYTAPASIYEVAKPKAAAVAPGGAATSKQFEFATALATIEEFEPFADKVKERDGILAVNGSERTITVTWDSAKLDEAAVRRLLAELGHAVK